MNLRAALLDAWALVMPVECAGCGAPDRSLCDACVGSLIPLPTTRSTPHGLRVVTALRYEGVVRSVILALKEQHRTDAAGALAPSFAAAVGRMLPLAGGVELVPVPTSRAAYRRRGYDPVALLVRRSGHPRSEVLRATRRTASQKTLGLAERARNLSGAFAAKGDLTSRSFVLVDDVMTTGATLDEAARALSAAGGRVLGAATLAFTPRIFAFRDNTKDEDYGGATGAQ